MSKQSGFTLVELVIVCAIIAILVAIALPSYESYIEKAQCEDGKALMTNTANFMERYRAQNNGSYSGATLNGFSSSTDVFAIAVGNVSATSYTLTATTSATARISGDLTVNAANIHGGSLTAKCSW